MTVILTLIALALPTIGGWLLLRAMEGKNIVLFSAERIALSFIIGTTGMMFLVFLGAIGFDLPLNRFGFLMLETFVCAVLWFICCLSVRGSAAETYRSKAPSPPLTRLEIAALAVLGLWTVLKVFAASVTFLLLVPTYINDSYTNWNLRAKVFYVHQSFDLSLPHRTAEDSGRIGVSSYPPTVPLLKTSIAAIGGSWNEAAINSVHGVWFLSCLVLCYSALRRRVSRAWAWIGVYALAGLPLYLMHGTNAYADVFLSANILAAVLPLFYALCTRVSHERKTYLRIAGLCMALLLFTKNEALLLYLPPLALLTILTLAALYGTGAINRAELLNFSAGYIVPMLIVGLSWISYKISHGLAFGNAQEISAFSLHWQPGALLSILGNTFLEGNWLLLFPFFWILLLAERRTAFTLPTIALSLFVICTYFLQLGSFLFTRLSLEAVRQTGYARGLIHIAPLVVIVSMLLLEHGLKRRLEE